MSIKPIAVMADIHGNHLALEACLRHARERGAETFWFLGDYLGELAYPQKTMEQLYALAAEADCVFLRGNKEDYWLDARQNGHSWQAGNSTTGALWYTNSHLTERDLHFFAALPISRVVSVPGMPPVTLCHGSPRSNREGLVPPCDTAAEGLACAETQLVLCGHRHRPGEFVHGGKRAVSPGAVGVALNHDGQAEYMLLHAEDSIWREEFIRVDYDVERTVAELHESGLDEIAPYWTRVTAQVVRGGGEAQVWVLSRAMEICREERGECRWPDIPEECWAKACEEMLKGKE